MWDNPYEGSVRIEGATMSTGTVLVYLRSMWGGVCADNFTSAEADSVCRQLGYTDSNGFYPSGWVYTSTQGKVVKRPVVV